MIKKLKNIFEKLFLSGKVNKRKVEANSLVLKLGYGSFDLAESMAKFYPEQKKIIKFATESIKKIDPIGGIPLGFPISFVVVFPDVLLWWNNLSDENQDKIFKSFDEKDLFDEEEKIKSKYLKIIIDEYKKSGAKLECFY